MINRARRLDRQTIQMAVMMYLKGRPGAVRDGQTLSLNGLKIAILLAALLMPWPLAPAWATVTPRAISSFYEDALVRFNKRDYGGAIIQLRNVLLEDPGNLAARILLGQAHLKVGAASLAEKELELARKAGADDELIIVSLAKAYLYQRKFAELLEFVIAGNRPPEIEAQVLIARATANIELLRYELASAEFNQAKTLAPYLLEPILGQAKILIRLGKFDEAAAQAEAARRLDPESYEVWYLKAELDRIGQRPEQALAAYNNTLAKAPGHLPARVGRARILIDLGRHSEATPDLSYIRQVHPDDPQPYYLQSLVYSRMGEPRKAQASLRYADQIIRGLDADFIRSHAPTLLLAGVVAAALEKLDEARFYLSEYIKMAPNHPSARHMLGALLIKQNRPQQAIEVVRPILTILPDDWRAMDLLATALMRTGKAAEATQILERAVTLMPHHTSLRTDLALSRLAIGQNDLAIDDLKTAMRQNPANIKPAMLLGLAHLRLHNYDQAVVVAEHVIKQNGDSAVAYNLIGGAQLGGGDSKAARASFEKALAVAPDYEPAQSNLARLDTDEGKLDAAKQRYETLLRADPQAVAPMIALSSIAEKQGDLDQAIQWLEKAGAFKSPDIASQLYLIDLYHRANRAENALYLTIRLKQDFSSNLAILGAVGKTELKTGAVEDAVKTFRRMANMRPDSAADLLKISRLQTSANDFEGAFNTLRRAVWVAPENFEAQKAIIKLEIQLGKFDAAQERANELRLSMPESGIGERLHGDVMMAAKNYAAAIADYQASIEKSDADTELMIRIYLARYHAGRRAEAIEDLESWVESHPDDLDAQRTLAAGYIGVERSSQAILAHEKLLTRLPDDSEILNNLAWLYLQTGDKRALSYAQKAYSVAPSDAAVIDTLGWIMVRGGQPAEGLALLRQANARSARQPRIRYHMAVALSDLGRLDEARKALRAIVQEVEKSDPKLARQARNTLANMSE